MIFDLYCENEFGEKFTIELQKAKQENFKDRLLYYSTFSLQEQGKKGYWDYKLKAVYVVAILDFVFDELIRDKVVRNIKLLDIDTKEVFSDNLNFVTVEMPNFIKAEEDLETNLDKWLYLLRHLYTLNSIPLRFQKTILEKVFKIAEYTALSDAAKQEYEESLKDYNDLKNSLDTAENKGYHKAEIIYLPQIEEAKQKEQAERILKEEAIQNEQKAIQNEIQAKNDLKNIILKFQGKGFTLEEIAIDLGKSMEQVLEILQ